MAVFKYHLDKIELDKDCVEAVNNQREDILNHPELCSPWKLSETIQQAYKNHTQKGELKVDPMVKMQQDELRFIVQTDFEDLEYRRKIDLDYGIVHKSELVSLFKDIRASHHLNKTRSDDLLILQKVRYDKTSLPKGLFFDGSFAFLRSSAFIYHAVKPSDSSMFSSGDEDNPASKGRVSLYDRRLAHANSNYSSRTLSVDALLLQVKGLLAASGADSERVKAELKQYLNPPSEE